MTFTERVVKECLKQLGQPYIWAGKGDMLWTMEKGLVPAAHFGFDCIGLILWGMWKAGGPDWRGLHNAKTLYHELAKQGVPNNRQVHLRYYGEDTANISHISLGICWMETEALIVEAAGGGHNTKSPTPNANVRVNFETRTDYVGSTILPSF